MKLSNLNILCIISMLFIQISFNRDKNTEAHPGTRLSSSPTSCTPGSTLNQASFPLLSICSPTCRAGGFATNGGSRLPASTIASFSSLSSAAFAGANFGGGGCKLWTATASSRFRISSCCFSLSMSSFCSMISGIGNTPTGTLTFDSGLAGSGAGLSRKDGDTRLFATVVFSAFRKLVMLWKKLFTRLHTVQCKLYGDRRRECSML